MKLTVLGSGVAISDAKRATTGFVLEFGGNTLVIDLGFGCFKNMQKAGIDCSKVNNLFFTHFEHPDHINDLSAFLMARKGQIDFKMATPTQINLFAAEGFKEFAGNLLDAYPFLKDLPFKLNVSELPSFGTKKFSHFTLTTKRMKHTESSLGYRFAIGKKSIVFSGDTEFNENLIDLADSCDLLVAECSFVKKSSGHITVEEAAKIAEKAKAKALLLSHFYPEAEKADLKSIAGKHFKRRVYIAKDLMKVNI